MQHPDFIARCRPAMASVAAVLLVAACGDRDTTPLESTPAPAAAADAAGTLMAAAQAGNTWTHQTDLPTQRSMPILAAVAKATGNTRLFAIGAAS